MIHSKYLGALAVFSVLAVQTVGQEGGGAAIRPDFSQAAGNVQAQLEASVAELNSLRESIRAEQVPLNKQLRELEGTLSALRKESQEKSRDLTARDFEVANLEKDIKAREGERTYLSGLFDQYIQNFAAMIHIAEKQRHDTVIESGRLAPQDTNLTDRQKFERQAEVLSLSLERLDEALGGARFPGRAKDSSGYLAEGTFVLVGPTAVFRSETGAEVGTAEQRIGSSEPSVIPFKEPALRDTAAQFVTGTGTEMPLDPTLGNAHKIAALDETFWEHVQKGGAVMIPLFGMAAIALLLAVVKWLSMAFLRNPSRKQVDELLVEVGRRDQDAAMGSVSRMHGPVGKMLQKGVENMRQPAAYVEELMYETVLRTRLSLQSYLPFIAICAASAPLLGLLGTVTGIISTFKLITAFGSGDASTLSSGISEALITTKFGLIVAIPSLLLHAYLSRKARGVVGDMETTAIAFMNQLGKAPEGRGVETVSAPRVGGGAGPVTVEPDPQLVRQQVGEILRDMLGPVSEGGAAPTAGRT